MKVLFALSALVILNFVSAVVIPEERAEEDELDRIIRGKSATEEQFPWAAALYVNGNYFCTCSIISNRTVLTAAHCVTDRNGNSQTPGSFYAIANHKKSSPVLRIDFSKLVVHPKYNPTFIEHDVAVLTSSKVIPTQPDVQRVCIAGPKTEPMQYKNATAMGWGNLTPIRPFPIVPDTLQYVEQTILENHKCTALGAPFMNKNKMCATGLFNGVCNGDSGGPLVHLNNTQEPVQLGVTSYVGIRGCGTISPGVCARVSMYNDFIVSNVIDPENLCIL